MSVRHVFFHVLTPASAPFVACPPGGHTHNVPFYARTLAAKEMDPYLLCVQITYKFILLVLGARTRVHLVSAPFCTKTHFSLNCVRS